MIGYLSGKILSSEEGGLLLDVNGVGYAVQVPARLAVGFAPGAALALHIHTNLRENALELFGFADPWEKRIFQALVGVSGVGPRTALSMLGGIDPEILLSAIVRQDRATLTSAPGVGKKTAERLMLELGEKARALLAERPALAKRKAGDGGESAGSGARAPRATAAIPPQGATAFDRASVDIADLWNEATAALVGLGYREGDAIAAIRVASNRADQNKKTGETPMTLEKLVIASLQLMSKGVTS